MSRQKTGKNPKHPVSIKRNETSIHPPAAIRPGSTREIYLILFFLTIVTLVLYRGVFTSDFAYYDDDHYILSNDHIHQGLTWEGIKWAFTSIGYSDNWHPLTWLSHMLDIQLFGLNPSGHHFTNLILHILATLLLFGLLFYSTGEIRLSAIVAALFAWHPLHVESVAWIAERKDVLSAVFWFSSLWSYVYYSRKPTIFRYAAVILLFALGLLSKPMLVTLPFVMLLFDLWPLERMTIAKRNYVWLIAEKLPLFALVTVSAVITIIAQQNALRSFTAYTLSTRIFNAIISYCVYIGQVFWPGKLAVLYPYTRPQLLSVIFCSIVLIFITATVVFLGRHKKHLITGWLWYLGTLVPVIGIIQVGSQAHADRYTYIPFIGVFIMLVWGLNAFMVKITGRKKIIARFALIAVFFAMFIKTHEQVGYWKDGITLLTHTIAITKNNEIAHYNLGNLMQQAGRMEEAIAQYNESLKINPNKIHALGNLAGVYYQTKQYEKAKLLIKRAFELAKAAGDEQTAKDYIDNIELLNHVMNSDQDSASER
jgi:hypothetical protein